jgi:uncharacterized protein with HEPN domain
MQADSKKYLWDAQGACDLISTFVAGKSMKSYVSDPMLRAAVERQLEIAGEALGQFAKRDPETATLIPELPRIVAFRNILIHGYATVDDSIVWAIVETKVPALTEAIRRVLGE